MLGLKILFTLSFIFSVTVVASGVQPSKPTKSPSTKNPSQGPSLWPTYAPNNNPKLGFIFVSGDDADHHVGKNFGTLI
jgi:hypothetical protein